MDMSYRSPIEARLLFDLHVGSLNNNNASGLWYVCNNTDRSIPVQFRLYASANSGLSRSNRGASGAHVASKDAQGGVPTAISSLLCMYIHKYGVTASAM